MATLMAEPTLVDYLASKNGQAVKLHLGCGGVRWRDFINVDLYPHDPDRVDSSRRGCNADAFADMRNLGLADGTISEIFTSHTLEHFTKWEAQAMLRDWHRMLKKGGELVMETPDFWRCVLWLFHPSAKKRQLGRNQFYGNQWDQIDFETHRYVWSAKEIRAELLAIGFDRVKVTHKTKTHYKGRDMRIMAWK